jgi:hypothetical protein
MINSSSINEKKELAELRVKEMAFEREFTSQGFQRIRIEADGNCFYRSIRILHF